MEKITIKPLVTRETPRQILEEDYPSHKWPISGGWGYTEDEACVVELDTEIDGVPFEYEFLRYRTYEELIVFKPRGEGYAGIDIKPQSQLTIHKGNKHYDKVTFKVTAFPEKDWDMLKEDWDSHNGYKDDIEGGTKHLSLRMSKMVSYETVGYFDITRFFGKRGI